MGLIRDCIKYLLFFIPFTLYCLNTSWEDERQTIKISKLEEYISIADSHLKDKNIDLEKYDIFSFSLLSCTKARSKLIFGDLGKYMPKQAILKFPYSSILEHKIVSMKADEKEDLIAISREVNGWIWKETVLSSLHWDGNQWNGPFEVIKTDKCIDSYFLVTSNGKAYLIYTTLTSGYSVDTINISKWDGDKWAQPIELKSSDEVIDAKIDKNGNLIFYLSNQHKFYLYKNSSVTSFEIDENLQSSICSDKNGDLIVLTAKFIDNNYVVSSFKWNGDKLEKTVLSHNENIDQETKLYLFLIKNTLIAFWKALVDENYFQIKSFASDGTKWSICQNIEAKFNYNFNGCIWDEKKDFLHFIWKIKEKENTYKIYSQVFDGNIWSDKILISEQNTVPLNIQLKTNKNGNAICLWNNYPNPFITCVIWNGISWGNQHNFDSKSSNFLYLAEIDDFDNVLLSRSYANINENNSCFSYFSDNHWVDFYSCPFKGAKFIDLLTINGMIYLIFDSPALHSIYYFPYCYSVFQQGKIGELLDLNR